MSNINENNIKLLEKCNSYIEKLLKIESVNKMINECNNLTNTIVLIIIIFIYRKKNIDHNLFI